MRKFLFLQILVLVVVAACQALAGRSFSSFTPSPVLPAPSPSADPSPLPSPLPSPGFTPTQPGAQFFTVRYHPDGPLFVGDQVSFEVIAPPDLDLEEKQVRVEVMLADWEEIATAGFGSFGIGGRFQATVNWGWDTRGLEPGEYSLRFSVQPDGEEWIETVRLHPAGQVPPPEPQARWETVESDCCIVHFITGTDAARDLPLLLEIADRQGQRAIRRMGVEFSDPIPITLLPRVLGHGGFASNEIYISYLDRNYAGNDFAMVLHHEMIHILDSRLGGELRPSILVEGLAVYLTGGHFKPEPLLPRAAALLDLGYYLPLAPLADDFYRSQHEAGYLQGAALIQFLVNRYGWEAFSDFYRDIHPHSSGKQSLAIDAALQEHYGLTLPELESQFVSYLSRLHVNPDLYQDVRLTILFYDTVRRYQLLLDPSAYFLNAWLPSGQEMRDREIVADYLRRPSLPENLVIERLLVEADRELRAGNYSAAERLLVSVDSRLDDISRQMPVQPEEQPVPLFWFGTLWPRDTRAKVRP
jgi:hypothetical protein